MKIFKVKKILFLVLIFSLFLSFSVFSKTRVAIFNFEAKGEGVSTGLAEAVTENLITYMINSKSFEVIERHKLNQIMSELNLQNSDDFSDVKRQELGKQYGIELAIFGSVTKIGDNITINARGVDIETGIAKFAKNVYTDSVNDIPSLISLLVDYIVKASELDSNHKDVKEKEEIKNELDKIDEKIEMLEEEEDKDDVIVEKDRIDKIKTELIDEKGKILIGQFTTTWGWDSNVFFVDEVKGLKDYNFSKILLSAENNSIEFKKIKIYFDDMNPNFVYDEFLVVKANSAKTIETTNDNGKPRQIIKIKVKFQNMESEGPEDAVLKVYGIK